jgi:uncharacterized protein YbjT (DUF2867 family)
MERSGGTGDRTATSETYMRRAIVLRSSGFVGSHLLQALLDSPDYDRVTAIVRKPLAISHAKLNVLIGDYHTLAGLRSEIHGDDLFITLGTTRKNSPNQAEHYQVDHDYPVCVAKTRSQRRLTLHNGGSGRDALRRHLKASNDSESTQTPRGVCKVQL